MPGIAFDRAVAYYDATRSLPEGVSERARDAFVRLIGASPATRFLELGIGTGRVALPYIRAGYDYTGIDLSRAMMDRLRQKLAADPASASYHYRLCQGDVMQLPFAGAIADVVIIVLVLHLVGDWRQVLCEARRVLRHGGWLMISYNDHDERNQHDVEHGGPAPPRLVGKKWTEILTELGFDRQARPSARQIDNQAILRYLDELGARTQVTTLTEFREHPRSAREIAEHYRERIYSGEWHMPDEIHAEAIRRLDRWLEESCSNPDEPFSEHVPLKAILATWPTV